MALLVARVLPLSLPMSTWEAHMTSPADVPYADPEPMSELIEECRCVEAECEAHGVNLHPDHHDPTHAEAAVVSIDDKTQHLLDGISEYGG
jgi:hypothetical protein